MWRVCAVSGGTFDLALLQMYRQIYSRWKSGLSGCGDVYATVDCVLEMNFCDEHLVYV